MEKIIFKREGKSKAELLKCLETMKEKYSREILENNISIIQDKDKFIISGSKNILFLNFWIKAALTAFDNEIIFEYETNVPKRYQSDAEQLFRKMINDACQ